MNTPEDAVFGLAASLAYSNGVNDYIMYVNKAVYTSNIYVRFKSIKFNIDLVSIGGRYDSFMSYTDSRYTLHRDFIWNWANLITPLLEDGKIVEVSYIGGKSNYQIYARDMSPGEFSNLFEYIPYNNLNCGYTIFELAPCHGVHHRGLSTVCNSDMYTPNFAYLVDCTGDTVEHYSSRRSSFTGPNQVLSTLSRFRENSIWYVQYANGQGIAIKDPSC